MDVVGSVLLVIVAREQKSIASPVRENVLPIQAVLLQLLHPLLEHLTLLGLSTHNKLMADSVQIIATSGDVAGLCLTGYSNIVLSQ